MCDTRDVLTASEGSAAVITTTFFDFGNGSLGEGIRRFAREMFLAGEEAGYYAGKKEGILVGSVMATGVISVLAAIGWGANRILKKEKAKLIMAENVKLEEEMEDGKTKI